MDGKNPWISVPEVPKVPCAMSMTLTTKIINIANPRLSSLIRVLHCQEVFQLTLSMVPTSKNITALATWRSILFLLEKAKTISCGLRSIEIYLWFSLLLTAYAQTSIACSPKHCWLPPEVPSTTIHCTARYRYWNCWSYHRN